MKKPSKIYIDLTVRMGTELLDAKPAALKVNSVIVKKIARSAVEELETGSCELSICLTDDAGIRALNRRYRGKDKATDVLSFSMDDGNDDDGNDDGSDDDENGGDGGVRVLGDVVISVETARAQAESFGVEFSAEMTRLLAHGILHLLGFDHVNGGRQAARMKREEERLIKLVGARL